MAFDDSSQSIDINQLKRRFLECGVCLQEFDEDSHHPRLLPCLHSFCFSCVKELIKDDKLKCPFCSFLHHVPNADVSIFRKDNTRRDLLDFVRVTDAPSKLICECCVEENQATYRCKNCSEFLCNECYKSHRRTRKLSHHVVISLSDFKCSSDDMEYFSHSVCSIHDEDLKFFCELESCQKPICTSCAITKHKESSGHIVKDINEIYSEMKSQLDGLMKSLESKAIDIDSVIENIEEEEKRVKSDSLAVQKEIEEDFVKFSEYLDKRRQSLEQEVQKVEQIKLKLLDVQKNDLTGMREDILQSSEVLQQSHLSKNASAFLQIAPVIGNRLSQLQHSEFETELAAEAGTMYSSAKTSEHFQTIISKLGTVTSDGIHGFRLKVECEVKIDVNTDLLVAVIPEKYNKRYFCEKGCDIFIELTLPGIQGIKSKTSGENDRFMGVVRSSRLGNNVINVYINGVLVEYDTKHVHVYAEGSTFYHKVEEGMKSSSQLFNLPDVKFEDLSPFTARFISTDKRKMSNDREICNTPFPNMHGLGSIPMSAKSGKVYFDCKVCYILKQKKIGKIFEIGFSHEPIATVDDDRNTSVWSVEATSCNHEPCNGFGLHAKYNDDILCHYSLSPVVRDVECTVMFGFLSDADSQRIFVLDKEKRQIIYSFEYVNYNDPIWPVFRICNKDIAIVSIYLISKKDIKPV